MKFYTRITLLFLAFSVLFVFHRPAQAKDEWIQVRSKNFLLIGNASEKDIRKVGTRLEQFRETFRLLFAGTNLTSPITTNVVVFKSDSYYKNFKPKRADGKIDNFVAGFFQPGEDVNYITLSTEGEDAETFSTIFHEYVHFIVNTNFGKSEVPPWFNEGLAEYYSTFEIEADQKVKLGLPETRHLQLLSQNKLMPLDSLFKISNFQLLQTGDHSRSIFYAESWALIHYLIQGGKAEGLGKFLAALLKDTPPEKAFQEAFQVSIAQMEKDLGKYVGQSSYQYTNFVFKTKLLFDADMQAAPLGEAGSNAYLGDLLYHANRIDDSEPYLVNALKLEPDSSMANTTLGMVKIKQRKFDEATKYLEKALAGDPRNYAAFYQYAFLLSREGRDEFGYVRRFAPELAAKMRESLRKAIAINPAFTESYELLAYVDLVNNEELDDALKMMKTALRFQPGNQHCALRAAEILSRQKKYAEAAVIAEKIARTSDEAEIKTRAEGLVAQIAQQKEFDERNEAERKRYEAALAGAAGGPPRPLRRIEGVKEPTEAEKAKQQAEEQLRSINDALRKPGDGEQRVLGHIQKIDCKKRPIVYTIKAASETFALTSNDFAALTLISLDSAAANAEVGCDADVSALNALVTYRTTAVPKSTTTVGELVAVEFVPADFRIMTAEEMHAATLVIYDQQDISQNPATMTGPRPNMPSEADLEARRRAMMMQSIRDTIKKPGEGEKREMGYLDTIECSGKNAVFRMRTAAQTLRLRNSSPESLKIIFYAPDLASAVFTCGIKPIEFPAVFVYSDKADAKTKTAGEILSIEFVPKSFVLEP